MIDKEYQDLTGSDIAIVLGLLYSISSFSVGNGFFSVYGYEYQALFSVLDNAAFAFVVVKNLSLYATFAFAFIYFFETSRESKFGSLVSSVVGAVRGVVTNDDGFVSDRVHLFWITSLAIGFFSGSRILPDSWFATRSFIATIGLLIFLSSFFLLFKRGRVKFFVFLVFIAFGCSAFFDSFGKIWAESIRTNYSRPLNVTRLDGVCFGRVVLRSGSTGSLYWSVEGAYVEFIPNSQIRSISALACAPRS